MTSCEPEYLTITHNAFGKAKSRLPTKPHMWPHVKEWRQRVVNLARTARHATHHCAGPRNESRSHCVHSGPFHASMTGFQTMLRNVNSKLVSMERLHMRTTARPHTPDICKRASQGVAAWTHIFRLECQVNKTKTSWCQQAQHKHSRMLPTTKKNCSPVAADRSTVERSPTGFEAFNRSSGGQISATLICTGFI
jgi:hypothetical protein